ncbi:maleylpyruvate isomerase N-terminal domain-containing protein [Streptomyces yerevanensis]|uniref:maleylpyruvate isomerase N-terminal domain-containing protein n=1 Tax=Streptomyces yerevanensis TaxID=66378 RepID=UPI000AFAA170|nr:maleylpyruvate isomerase N-terminal domain-containing protein [Streptomyces yerevanensis]
MIEAHGTLERLVAGLNDQQVAEASVLPGRSRGHVLAHLTDNARMFARLEEHALHLCRHRATDLRPPVARWLRRCEAATHDGWTVFLRGVNGSRPQISDAVRHRPVVGCAA